MHLIQRASSSDNVELVHLLLSNGANPNYAPDDWPPLHTATVSERLNICRVLIQAGADATWKSSDRYTLIDSLRPEITCSDGTVLRQAIRNVILSSGGQYSGKNFIRNLRSSCNISQDISRR